MVEFKGWTLLKKVNSIFLICASFRVFPEYSSLVPRAACASYTLGPKQDKKVALETRFDWLNCSTKIFTNSTPFSFPKIFTGLSLKPFDSCTYRP